MNLPNVFLLYRFLAVPVFIVFFMLDWQIATLAVFITAAISDFFDGYFARKLGLVNDFGKLMDPLADKILVSAAFICLCEAGVVPAWAVVVIVAREFLVTGLRGLATTKGVVMAAGWSGKIKTVLQMTAIGFLLCSGLWYLGEIGIWIMWAAVAATIYSGAEYFWKSRKLFTTK